MTYLLVPEKTGDRGSFFLMNSMILSSLLAVWAGNSGAEGNRARSSSASDTGQFNNSDTRWLGVVVWKCRVLRTVEEGHFVRVNKLRGYTGGKKDKRKKKSEHANNLHSEIQYAREIKSKHKTSKNKNKEGTGCESCIIHVALWVDWLVCH